VYVLYLLHFHMPYGFAILGAVAAAVLMGILVERAIVRPLFDAPRVILLVATAGVALLALGIEIWFGEFTPRPVAKALPTDDRITILGVQVSDQRLLLLAALAVIAALLAYFFNRTNLGLAILGASQEPTATELMGISVKRLSTIVWALAALLGGLAGVLAVPARGSGTVEPGTLTLAFLIPALTAAVLGGMTSLPGAFLGGVIVGVVEAVGTSAPIFEDIPGTPGTLLVFLVLLIVLTARPQGLLGKAG
jgi:branched-chain amino acid transport system permease protein